MYIIEPSDPEESLCSMQAGFSRRVDFCIWVLEIDGLQVDPFTHHSTGNSCLSSLGFDMKAWAFWLKSIIVVQDPRLEWYEEDIDGNVEAELEGMIRLQQRSMSDYSSPEVQASFNLQERQELEQDFEEWERDRPTKISGWRNELKRVAVWRDQQYRKALQGLRQLPEPIQNLPDDTPPPELWLGSSNIKTKLQELWQQYRADSSVIDRPPVSAPLGRRSEYADELDEHNKSLGFLKVYLIAYPVAVEYVVPPNTIIMSTLRDQPYNHTWGESLLKGAKALVALNNA